MKPTPNAETIRHSTDIISVAMFALQTLEAESRDVADFSTARAARVAISQLTDTENGLLTHAASLSGFFGVN